MKRSKVNKSKRNNRKRNKRSMRKNMKGGGNIKLILNLFRDYIELLKGPIKAKFSLCGPDPTVVFIKGNVEKVIFTTEILNKQQTIQPLTI